MKKHVKVFVLATILAVGRYPVAWLLSSAKRRRGPQRIKSGRSVKLSCASGNTWHIELAGRAEGQPLVLIHGLNSSIQQWYYQRLFFEKHYRLILADLPGHGHSSPPATLSLAALADDLEELLAASCPQSPVLYGHSLGAMIIMEYCKRYPQAAVKAIILQHGSFTNPLKTSAFPWLAKVWKPLLEPFFKGVKTFSGLVWFFAWLYYLSGLSVLFYRFLFFTGSQTPKQLLFISRIAAGCPPAVLAEGMLQLVKHEATDALGRFSMPALVIGAPDDRLVRPDACRFIAGQIPKGIYVTVPGGHQSLVEHPHRINKALWGFLHTLKG